MYFLVVSSLTPGHEVYSLNLYKDIIKKKKKLYKILKKNLTRF